MTGKGGNHVSSIKCSNAEEGLPIKTFVDEQQTENNFPIPKNGKHDINCLLPISEKEEITLLIPNKYYLHVRHRDAQLINKKCPIPKMSKTKIWNHVSDSQTWRKAENTFPISNNEKKTEFTFLIPKR